MDLQLKKTLLSKKVKNYYYYLTKKALFKTYLRSYCVQALKEKLLGKDWKERIIEKGIKHENRIILLLGSCYVATFIKSLKLEGSNTF